LDNGIVQVHLAPDLGGRIIQYQLGSFEYLWTNQRLHGKLPPPGGLGPDGGWLNYGGDKLWPAPQGWDNENQWPGPPDPILDTGPYTIPIQTGQDNLECVEMTSPNDPRTGIRFTRQLRLTPHSSQVKITATMTNIDTRKRRWGIWSNTQLNAANRRGPGYNPHVWGFCPLNPQSRWAKGYNVMFGSEDNPSYKPDSDRRLMCVHYERLLGKIGIDSDAGWAAVVDGTDGYAFVQRFAFAPGRDYPDGASVEIWMDGIGKIIVGGKTWEGTDDPLATPYIFESEVLSPMEELQPGESSTFRYEWCAANVGGNYPVLDCTDVGVVSEPVRCVRGEETIRLGGRLGAFFTGRCVAVFTDVLGNPLGRADLNLEITPLQPLIFHSMELGPVPKNTVTISLELEGNHGTILGELAHVAC
jgi:hypothetical protein